MSAPRYRLVIEGELGPRYASVFDGMTLHTHHGETEITGPVTDDAHLQGLIQRIPGLEFRVNSLGDPISHAAGAGVLTDPTSTDTDSKP